MRRAIAFILFVFLVFPLLFGAFAFASVRGWIADRGFYERLAETPFFTSSNTDLNPINLLIGSDTSVTRSAIPNTALVAGLQAALRSDMVSLQSKTFVSAVFDYLEGKQGTVNGTIDLTNIKRILASSEGINAFAEAYVQALPTCTPNQQPTQSVTATIRLVTCLNAAMPADRAVAQVSESFPSLIANAPDSFTLQNVFDNAINSQVNNSISVQEARAGQEALRAGYQFLTGVGLTLLTAIGIAFAVFMTVIVGMIAARTAKGAFTWIGAMIIPPALSVLLIGLFFNIATVDSSRAAESATAAAFEVIRQPIASGFTSAAIAALFAAGLIFLIALTSPPELVVPAAMTLEDMLASGQLNTPYGADPYKSKNT